VVPVAATVGKGFTIMFTVAVFVQPLEPVTVTVYTVVAVGVTVWLGPVKEPGNQE
jgi:hypothetical protein